MIPIYCTMCGEALTNNYDIGWICPKTYGDWYHFSIGYDDGKLAYVNFILESHQLHVYIDYRKNKTVITSMENKEKSKQTAHIDYAASIDIHDKKAIEQKIKLLATFS